MNRNVLESMFGTCLSAIGTGFQTNELLQTISLILTIVGALITIIMALVNWWQKAHKDGKIDKDEIKEGVDIIKDGVDSINDILKDKEEKE